MGGGNWEWEQGTGNGAENWECSRELGMERNCTGNVSSELFTQPYKDLMCCYKDRGFVLAQLSNVKQDLGSQWEFGIWTSSYFIPICALGSEREFGNGTRSGQCPLSQQRSQAAVLIFSTLEHSGNGHPRLEQQGNVRSGMKNLSQAEDFRNS